MKEATRSTVLLGRELDDSIRVDLKSVLSDLGAIPDQANWGVAGSQEIESLKVFVRGESLLVEAETYIGLSITGPAGLVAEIKTLIEARRAGR